MNSIFKKICLFTGLASLLVSLTACSGDNKVKKEILDSDSDNEASVAILTDSKKDDFEAYDASMAIKEQYGVKKKNKLTKAQIVDYHLPNKDMTNYEKDKKRVLDKIKENREIKGLVVSTSDPNIISALKELKKSRKDMLLVSADQATSIDKNTTDNKTKDVAAGTRDLMDTFDMNFKTAQPDRTKRIAELAKTLGAERTIAIVDDNLSASVKLNLDGLDRETKSYGMAYEEVSLPKLEANEKVAYVSNLIDEMTKKYGDKVNYYPTSKLIDDILISRITENNFYVAELSQPNKLADILDKYSIKYIYRQRYEYAYLNSQVSTFLSRINASGNRMGSSSAEPKNHTLRMALELAVNITGKGTDIEKCYNPYFLEKISTFRIKLNAAFSNVSKGTKNYKQVDPDPYIY